MARTAGSEAGAAGAGLAARAAVGGPVHEGIAPDRRAAPQAGEAFPPVYREGPLEVAALPVDVDVHVVERGPADGEGLAEHVADRGEQAAHLRAVQGLGGPGPM